ncbi:phytanoyl-CoA dioxygenase family protein [Candidatus Poribacteria bacterium]|nr:phytanoyl-CoA dioxygenase family protein [Candidatus Poribacteria bacterium]
MKYDEANRTFDCEPTLTDTQVLQFCRDGYLQLQGVVPDEINQRTFDYLNGDVPINPCFIPNGMTHTDLERMRDTHEPSSILLEDWYIEHVLLNRELAGALRSLLGKNVGLPVLVSNHRVECPMPAQGWHHDADHVFGPEINFVEVFYFPQDTPLEMGPTELLPGSHIHSTSRDINEKGVSSAGPAGSFVIHSQSILHRRGESNAEGLRHMLKYSYWRTVPPTRDWQQAPDFDFQTAEYGGHGIARYVAHMFYWLCGKGDEFRLIGGQAWPWSSVNQIGPSYGFGHTEGYLPNWRKDNPDDYAAP